MPGLLHSTFYYEYITQHKKTLFARATNWLSFGSYNVSCCYYIKSKNPVKRREDYFLRLTFTGREYLKIE